MTKVGQDGRVDDHLAQFLVSVGRLCADAHIGGLTVRLRFTDGAEVVGIPDPPPEGEGSGTLDDTGYVDEVGVDGLALRLSDVAEATIQRPASA